MNNQIDRVWNSAGAFSAWGHKLGLGTRALLFASKTADLGLTFCRIRPAGKTLERGRLNLLGKSSFAVAHADEAEQIVGLLKLRDKDFTPPLTSRPAFADLGAFVQKKFEIGEWIVAKRGRIVVGIMYLYMEGPRCRFGCIAVHPQIGKGSGAGMVELGIDRAKQLGATSVFVSTSSNSPSIPLLKGRQAVITERIANSRAPGVDELWWEFKI